MPGLPGIWLTRASQAKDAADPDLRWLEIELWKDQDRLTCLSPAGMPKDGVRWYPSYGEAGVVVDHCVHCSGVWLDQVEFQRILAALEQGAGLQARLEYLKESLDDSRRAVSRPKASPPSGGDFMTVTRLMQYRLLGEPEAARRPDSLRGSLPWRRDKLVWKQQRRRRALGRHLERLDRHLEN
jgi:Zn-finger nucleic acid-binding protein